MTKSLRLRLLLGSILWTLGLLWVAHMLSLTVMSHLAGHGAVRVVLLSDHGADAAPGASLDQVRTNLRERNGGMYSKASLFAAVSMAAGLWLVWSSVRPLFGLRRRLAAVRHGEEQRVTGSYPSEVQPLVNDLNALLDHREQVVARAIARAGDLAHGLKTPLAVLSQEAERTLAAGQAEIGGAISHQVERMRRQIDYHLAQARAAAAGASLGARSVLKVSLDGLARTLERLHAGRGLTITIDVPPELAVRVQREDLDEMLGNLLDNACKWARSVVRVRSSAEGGVAVIEVEDDGPGIDPSMREAVLRRGVRADEAAPGSGLGLAIVRDLAELYGGSISLGTSSLGGLRADLRLPA